MQPLGLVMVDPFAPLETCEELGKIIGQVRRDQEGERLAEHLRGGCTHRAVPRPGSSW